VRLTDEDWEFVERYLPIGEYGPYPAHLRQQFEGVIWRFKTGGQWREMSQEFGATAKNKADGTPKRIPSGRSDDASAAAGSSA
jgi:transposase